MKRVIAGVLSCAFFAACSDAVTWTNTEIENGKRVFLAIEAANRAGELMQAIETSPGQEHLEQALLEHLRRAHVQAVQVNDAVLDKMHPSMHLNFRNRFQSSVGNLIRFYGGDESINVNSAIEEMAEFQEWFKAHQQELRLW